MTPDLTGAKVIMVHGQEPDNNFKNSMFVDKLILEKDGETYQVESYGTGQLNICKII